MKKEKSKRAISDIFAGLDAISGRETIIELHGNREMLLSGCTGIRDYSPVRILLGTDKCSVAVLGKCLQLSVFRDDILSISGKIDCISFVGEDFEK